jgi:hypothetical protein
MAFASERQLATVCLGVLFFGHAARDVNGGSAGYKLGDFGLATLKSGHWRVTEGDSR